MGLGQGDLVLRDQFILGLKEGPVRQELCRQVRKAPQLTFDWRMNKDSNGLLSSVQHRFQRLATVSAVDPDAVRDGKELSILNVGPGVVEVNLVDTADPDKPEVNETTNALPLSKGDGLTDDEQRQLNELLRRWSHVFSIHEEDYGRTGAVKHQIPTGDSNPIRERDFPEHLQHLEAVFRSLGQYGLKLRPEKCQLFQRQVKFLVHVVSSQGVSADPDKTACSPRPGIGRRGETGWGSRLCLWTLRPIAGGGTQSAGEVYKMKTPTYKA
uniref:Reverse transcriptase n=1 Tax=Knipowitschia caucasica TaxID=637954 RepID=A0AAV2MC89_KNICA